MLYLYYLCILIYCIVLPLYGGDADQSKCPFTQHHVAVPQEWDDVPGAAHLTSVAFTLQTLPYTYANHHGKYKAITVYAGLVEGSSKFTSVFSTHAQFAMHADLRAVYQAHVTAPKGHQSVHLPLANNHEHYCAQIWKHINDRRLEEQERAHTTLCFAGLRVTTENRHLVCLNLPASAWDLPHIYEEENLVQSEHNHPVAILPFTEHCLTPRMHGALKEMRRYGGGSFAACMQKLHAYSNQFSTNSCHQLSYLTLHHAACRALLQQNGTTTSYSW